MSGKRSPSRNHLADGCEATVRATRPASPEELNEIVRKVIADRMAWGQLDECPLTLADLDQIRQSFAATLQGMFHPRLRYPGQEVKSDTGRLRGTGPLLAKNEGETERPTDGKQTDQV